MSLSKKCPNLVPLILFVLIRMIRLIIDCILKLLNHYGSKLKLNHLYAHHVTVEIGAHLFHVVTIAVVSGCENVLNIS